VRMGTSPVPADRSLRTTGTAQRRPELKLAVAGFFFNGKMRS